MRGSLVLFALLVGSPACGGDDAHDDVTDVDGNTDGGGDGGGGAGATVTWASRPAIPGEIEDGLTVTAMRFGLMDLRLVSDAGAVDLGRDELAWSAGVAPMADVAMDAPAAVYASIRGMVARGTGTYAFEIAGVADGTPYVVRDTEPLALTIPFPAVTLPAGGGFTLDVRVRVENLVEDIDFATLPLEGGIRVLDGRPATAAQLAELRLEINDNFTISGD